MAGRTRPVDHTERRSMKPLGQQHRPVSIYLGVLFAAIALCASVSAQAKNPMILIPGISGSELVHKGSMKKVWFRLTKTNDEDLRLPILADPTKMHDNLVASDVLR